MCIPALLCLSFFIAQDWMVVSRHIDSVREELDYYYNLGWPIENIRSDFNATYESNTLGAYISTLSTPNPVEVYEQTIEYRVEQSRQDLFDELSAYQDASAIFYIPEIQQDTTRYEALQDTFFEGDNSDNYDMMSWSLAEINQEITSLNLKQQDDLNKEIERLKKSISDLTIIGTFYKIDLSSYVSESASYSPDGSSNPLTTYSQLHDLRERPIADLDTAVTVRGGTPTDGKWILISIRSQRLYMIDDHTILYEMPAATGIAGHETAPGEFMVYEKIDMAWGYYRIWMPYWLTVYYSGGLKNGIHGIPVSPTIGRYSFWDNVVGNYPTTYGCIMPRDPDAKIVYDWADVGIPVSIVY